MKLFKKGVSTALSLLLAGGLVFPMIQSVPVEAIATGGYRDVKGTDWFFRYTIDCGITGLMGQSDDHMFRPYDKMTRAMVATVLYRAAGEPEVASSAAARFPDVKDGQWYSTGIAWAAENGVVNGYSNGNFGPFDNITREQMAVMIVNYLRSLDANTNVDYDLSVFTDLNKVSYGENALKFCVAYGIISGKENGTKLDPKSNATRAEAAKIILSGLTVNPLQTQPQEVIEQFVSEKLESNETEVSSVEVKSVADGVWRVMENESYKSGDPFFQLMAQTNPSAFFIIQHENQNLIVDAGKPLSHRYGPVNDWNKKLLKTIVGNLTNGQPASIALTNVTPEHSGLISTNDILDPSKIDAVLIPSGQSSLTHVIDGSWSSKVKTVQPNSSFVIDGSEYKTCEMNSFNAGTMTIYSPEKDLIFAGDNAKRDSHVFGNPDTNPLNLHKLDLENLKTIIADMENPELFVNHYTKAREDITTSRFLANADEKLAIIEGLKDGSTYIEELPEPGYANLSEDSLYAPEDAVELKNSYILSNNYFYTSSSNVDAYLSN